MDDPHKPLIAQLRSLKLDMEPGTYFWCACGRTKKQPFCDGSHKGTSFRPQKIQIESAQRVAWCMCRHSENGAICDHKHRELEGYEAKKK